MMITKTFLKHNLLSLFMLLIVAHLLSCGFQPGEGNICKAIEDFPLTELTEQNVTDLFQEDGTLIAKHGFGCAKDDNGGFIKVEQSLPIPRYANKATVFVNGWRMNYLDDDHPVRGLTTLVGKIRFQDGMLVWNAVGALGENDFDDGYNWCYYFTAIAWNDANLNVIVDHDDADQFCRYGTESADNFFYAENKGTTTALSSFPTFIKNLDFALTENVAILPRGFGFQWNDDDHHLLQTAYNMDHSEVTLEYKKKYKKADQEVSPELPNPASLVLGGFVNWDTYVILKDNALRRDYSFGEMVSGLGGSDVGILHQPFSILPVEDTGIFDPCIWEGGAEQQEFVIENIQYEYAIPMLTGWDLWFCDDEHIKEVGIWIDSMEWNPPGSTAGTLRYKLSSRLRDENSWPGHSYRHKVTILGLKPVAAARQAAPDLVPFSPSGNSDVAFCRLEPGRKLRVTVKNQGNADASASKTTVTFGDIPVTVNTPPIPKDGSVDILFDVPATCFSADCFFKITVDSNSQIGELNNEGNNSANGTCIG
ncbi:MAG: hypothetical protein L0Y68_01285 [Candidatus Dadabacteria bacterium]|nr:hypothetical protein [Candidatus Dadabacteria bacterium]